MREATFRKKLMGILNKIGEQEIELEKRIGGGRLNYIKRTKKAIEQLDKVTIKYRKEAVNEIREHFISPKEDLYLIGSSELYDAMIKNNGSSEFIWAELPGRDVEEFMFSIYLYKILPEDFEISKENFLEILIELEKIIKSDEQHCKSGKWIDEAIERREKRFEKKIRDSQSKIRDLLINKQLEVKT